MTMTVQDLLEILEDCEPEDEVRFASQPRWPFEYSVYEAEIVENEDDDGAVVYLVEGNQIGYLPGRVRERIGW